MQHVIAKIGRLLLSVLKHITRWLAVVGHVAVRLLSDWWKVFLDKPVSGLLLLAVLASAMIAACAALLRKFKPISTIRINAFTHVPLTASGFCVAGTALANFVADELQEMLTRVGTATAKVNENTGLDLQSGIALPVLANNVSVADIQVEVRGFSVATALSVWGLLRQHQHVVTGDLVQVGNEVWVRARIAEGGSWEAQIKDYQQLNNACREIARGLMEYVCPPVSGLLYAEEGNSNKAEDVYRGWVAREPHNYQAHFYLGGALASGEARSQAIAEYRTARRLNPRSAEVLYAYAYAMEVEGEDVEAESAYRQAIRINSHFAAALNSLGALLLEKNRTVEAVPLLEKAIEVQPQFSKALANLVAAYFKLGRYDDVIRILGQ
jgi:tetratricopeptide (TPR) repeat protein